MASSAFLCFLLLLTLFSSSISSSPNPITIALTQFKPNPFADPYQKLAQLASISLTRAHHLKNPQNTPVTTTPLSSHSYGDYSISLSFGTPPQKIPFIMDTGSHFVWFPCTHRYICKNCSSTGIDPPIIPRFIPKLSSSSKILGCLNPKCGWIHSNSDPQSRCQDCPPELKNCTQICPPYLILYGSGSTGGVTLLESLDLPGKKVPDFLVGCSLFSSHEPAGIAGFGRGPLSLPTQLGVKRFSYCLLSRKFDDTPGSSLLALDSGSDSGQKTGNLSYTHFLKNPVIAGKQAFSVYYYVGLRKITVGGKRVEIPFDSLSLGSDGNGGTIVDSGTAFTYLSYDLFELVISQFIIQIKQYERSDEAEYRSGLRPCFNVSGHETMSLPEMSFHFKGGAEMVLPLANYFVTAGALPAVCLTFVTDSAWGPERTGGPAIILGNFQMQNYNVEYDLRNERFGFRQELCK